MEIDKKFVDQLVKVTSKAALASSYLVGKKDKIAADKAAVDSMRSELNKLEMKGHIVIGKVNWMKLQCYILVKNLVQIMDLNLI